MWCGLRGRGGVYAPRGRVLLHGRGYRLGGGGGGTADKTLTIIMCATIINIIIKLFRSFKFEFFRG